MTGAFSRSLVSFPVAAALVLGGCSDAATVLEPHTGTPAPAPAPTQYELETLWLVYATPSELVKANANGSERYRIAQGEFKDIALSPDAARIAFSRRGHLYVIDIDGANLREPGSVQGSDPAWSPDGKRIAYAASDNSIHILEVATGVSISVTQPPAFSSDKSPAWAPDGMKIAFIRGDEDSGGMVEVIVLDTVTARWHSIPEEAVALRSSLLWSETGDQTAVVMSRHAIWLRNSGQSGPAPLTNHHSPSVVMELVDWSSNGKWILFRGGEPRETDHFFVIGMDGRFARLDLAEPWISAVFFDRSVPPPPPRGPSSFPELQRPGQIYAGPPDLYNHYYTGIHDGLLLSRYVLYDDGTISLQFLSNRFGFFEYPGHRTIEGGKLRFRFSGDPQWEATATLEAGKLTVTYNVIMMFDDFVDGVYVLEE